MKNTLPQSAIKCLVPRNRNAILCSLAMLASGAASLMAAPLLDYNFNSLTGGGANLVGQGSWVANGGGTSPVVKAGTGVDTSLVASGPATGTSPFAAKLNLSNFNLTTSDTVVLTFDLYTGSGGSIALFGIGVQGSSALPVIGIWNGDFAVRGDNNGTIINAKNSGGTNVTATASHWYQVQSTWSNLTGSGAGQATLSIRDLTLGETSFTQLFFNQAQTQATASLALSTSANVTGWNAAYLRVNASGSNPTAVDNLNVVPEPSAITLIGTAGVAGLLFLRRRCSQG